MLKAILLSLTLSFSAVQACAQSRGISEGARATAAVIHITTSSPNVRVHLATMAYSGAVANVSLYTTSNVVVGSGGAIVLYATGSVVVGGVVLTTTTLADILNSTNTWGAQQNFTQASTFTAPAAFLSSGNVTGQLFGNVHMTTQSARLTALTWGTETTIVARSTLTIVGSTITVYAMGTIVPSASGGVAAWGILIDGACPAWATCTGACSAMTPEGYRNPADGRNDFLIAERFTQAHGSVKVAVWACASQGSTATGTLSNFWLEAN